MSDEEIQQSKSDAAMVARELKAACRAIHEQNKGPGGAVVCICGMGCGGSSACLALGILRDMVRYGNLTSDKPSVQTFMNALRNYL